jgi:murein L,D-transpeptidase YcbB/YkuD
MDLGKHKGRNLMRYLGVAVFVVLGWVSPAGFAEDGASDALRQRVEQLMFEGRLQVDGVDVLATTLIAELYAGREYRLLWPSREKILELATLVELADAEGLNTEDYPWPAVLSLLPDSGLPGNDYDRADIDILATDTLIRIGYQLRYGKVNPSGLFPDWNFSRHLVQGVERSRTVERAVAAPSLVEFITGWVQRGPLYDQLMDALARYRRIEADGGWAAVPAGPTLRQGDSDPRVADLDRRLRITGDLSVSRADVTLFDEDLHAAVVLFQNRHGLDPDGVVGAKSYEALNVPVSRRIIQLRTSLERARWVMDEAGQIDHDLVLVNIASAQAALMRDGQPLFVTRVQVGKPYRQTPVFKGDIKYLVFNPTWTVPPGILRNDVLPRLKEDANGYLTSKNMDLLDREGKVVDHNAIDWSSITARRFPYMVRQRPGPWNALGRVKFIFPNPHFVFLHDTPSRELFERSERAFSSGCIRVEAPFDLAELVLSDPKWDQAAMRRVLDTERERVVHLSEPMPVFILYWTAMADADGTVRFYNDIYGRDKVLLEALRQPPVLDTSEAD